MRSLVVKKQNASSHHRQHGDAALEAERFILAANQIHQRHHQHRGEHAARRRQHKAPGLQGDALCRVVSDHPAKRAVRDIDHGIEQGQQGIGDGGVDHFAVQAEVWRGVGQHADQAKRDGTEQDPRTELTPAAAGAVGNQPHAGVGDGIQRTGQQEHGADEPGGDTEDIGIEKHHVQHNVIENDVTCGVTHAVTNFLFDRQNFAFHCYSFTRRGAETDYMFCKPSPTRQVLRFLVTFLRFLFFVIAVKVRRKS